MDEQQQRLVAPLLEDLERVSHTFQGAAMVVIDRKGIRYPFHSFAMARCEYLEAMTRHAWLESEEGEVTIDEEPEDVKLFHQFLHTAHYSLGGHVVHEKQKPVSDLEERARLYDCSSGEAAPLQSHRDQALASQAGSPPTSHKEPPSQSPLIPPQSPSDKASQSNPRIYPAQFELEPKGKIKPAVITHAYMYAMGDRLCSDRLMDYAKACFKQELDAAVKGEDHGTVTAALELIYDPQRYSWKNRFVIREDDLTLHKLFIGIYRRNRSIKDWVCIRDAASKLPEFREHLEKVRRGIPVDSALVIRT